MVNSRGTAKLPWNFGNSKSFSVRQTPASVQQFAAGPFSAGSFHPPCVFVSREGPYCNMRPFLWGCGAPPASMLGASAGCAGIFLQPPPPPPRSRPAMQPSSWLNRKNAYAVGTGRRMPFGCVPVKQQHQVQQHAAQKKKKTKAHRRSAFRRRRAAQKKQHQTPVQQQQEQPAIPQSPVCPPAPYNTNSYLMDLFAQQYAAEQAAKAAAAQLAEAAAANLEEAAEWDPIMQQVSALHVTTADSVCDGSEFLVCPAAPLLTNEYYMSRFKQQFAAEQAAQAAAVQLAEAAAAEREATAEWDPVMQQVSALQVSTADNLCDDDDLESPVCPPAPLLTNEYYMSRFEEELKQQAAAAAAPAPVVDAGVAEWDPLLREVTTLQHSTASSMPATLRASVDDSCCSSQC